MKSDSPAIHDGSAVPPEPHLPVSGGPFHEVADFSFDHTVANVRRTLCRHLRDRLLAHETAPEDRESFRERILREIDAVLREHSAALSFDDKQAVVEMVVDDVFEYGPISELMRDADISDVLINGPFQTYYEKGGQLVVSNATFDDAPHLLRIVERAVHPTGRELSRSSPLVDVRLPDGSRMNVILSPPAINGPIVSIRRFGARPLTAEDLVEKGALTEEMLYFLGECVRCRCNIVVSGGTGSGKTTLLNALSRYIRPNERIATIEDTAELELQQPHVVKFESCNADSRGGNEITIRRLMINSLRIRPDRIIIGECRGAEILEMLQAMNTGHEGSMTTIHANSPRDVLSRIELMVALGGIEIPLSALRKQVASSIDFVVQVARLLGGQRKIVSISEVTGMEGDVISMHDIFTFQQTAVVDDVAVGQFEASGVRPTCYERLVASGANLPSELFVAQRRHFWNRD